MSNDLEFPRLVYKRASGGNAEPIWNLGTFVTLTVQDKDEHAAALANGWSLEPEPAKPAEPEAKPAPKPAAKDA